MSLKYMPPKKGDKWDKEVLAGAFKKGQELASLKADSKEGLEGLLNDFFDQEFLTYSSEERKAVVQSYQAGINNSIGDYMIGNVKDVVGYVGKKEIMPLVLALPYAVRKAEEGKEVSDSDKKYAEIGKAKEKLKKLGDALKTPEGQRKELESELEKMNDFEKQIWLSALGPKRFIERRVNRFRENLSGAIESYGIDKYIQYAVEVSDSLEREQDIKLSELKAGQKAEIQSITDITPMQEGEINDKYTKKIKDLQEKYKGKIGARGLILNGAEEVPGLVPLFNSVYQEEKEAEEKDKK